MRKFETGATRNTDEGRIDPEAFLSPAVIDSYATYMNRNRVQADGGIRAGDNWQKGIPQDAYMKSMWRHFLDVWKAHRGIPTEHSMEDNLNALLFNVMGLQFETLKENAVAPSYEVVEEQDSGEGINHIFLDADSGQEEARIEENVFYGRSPFAGIDIEDLRRERERKFEAEAQARVERIPSTDTSFRSLSNLEPSEVLRVSTQRPESKGSALASSVRGTERSEGFVQWP